VFGPLAKLPVLPSVLRFILERQVRPARYPEAADPTPPAFRGMPTLVVERCLGHARCSVACPTGALTVAVDQSGWTWRHDKAMCNACGLCVEACPEQAIAISAEFELASRSRADLVAEVEFVREAAG
jgi:NADH-quinone oxidoreductase subunit I